MVIRILRFFRVSPMEFRFLFRHNLLYSKLLPAQRPCRIRSTTVERPLQIDQIMQNEPKLQKSQATVTTALTKIYENWTLGECGKNEPKRTQNEPNSKNPKIKLIHYLKRTYNIFRYFSPIKNEPKRTQNEPSPTIKDAKLMQLEKSTPKRQVPHRTNQPHFLIDNQRLIVNNTGFEPNAMKTKAQLQIINSKSKGPGGGIGRRASLRG